MADTIGTRVRQLISNSANLNDTREPMSRPTQDVGGLNEQGTDISFTSANTISSAGSGFPTLTAGSMIQVLGSPLNSRVWQVVTSSASTITVLPAQIQTESAGALIDIRTV